MVDTESRLGGVYSLFHRIHFQLVWLKYRIRGSRGVFQNCLAVVTASTVKLRVNVRWAWFIHQQTKVLAMIIEKVHIVNRVRKPVFSPRNCQEGSKRLLHS